MKILSLDFAEKECKCYGEESIKEASEKATEKIC